MGEGPFGTLIKAIGNDCKRSDLWGTPDTALSVIEEHFKVRLCRWDPAPYPKPPGFDGLLEPWRHPVGETLLVNPPYSQMDAWIAKMVAEARGGKSVIALLPNQSDRKWYPQVIEHAEEIAYVTGRMFYTQLDTGLIPRGGAPFAVMAVLFSKGGPAIKNGIRHGFIKVKKPKPRGWVPLRERRRREKP